MKISDLIIQLQEIEAEFGNLNVTTYEFGDVGVVDFRGARVKDIRAKRKREHKTYYTDYSDSVSIEKVVHV